MAPKAKSKAKGTPKRGVVKTKTKGKAAPGSEASGSPMTPKQIEELIRRSTPYTASLRAKPPAKAVLRVASWNVNGISALLKSNPGALKELVKREKLDLLLLQETKLQEKDVDAVRARCVPDGWSSEWSCSRQTLGYAGVAALWRSDYGVLSARPGVGLAAVDVEGRCLTLETPAYYVVGCYVPNAGDGLRRLDLRIRSWEPAVRRHLQSLARKKPVVYCGDLNVCHQELDLWGNHGPNSRAAGYTPEERGAMSELLASNRLVDTFRHKHPGVRAFSYWSYRFNAKQKNNGWRLDHFLLSASHAHRVHDAYILPDVKGSDHCPVGLTLV